MDKLTRKCTAKCQEYKLANTRNFRKNPGGRLGLRSVCRKCENEYNRAKAKLNKDKWGPAKRNSELMRKYSINLDTYNQMLADQNSRCKICSSQDVNHSKNKNFCVDHCHKTGQVRGLLCNHCNTMIGMIEKIAQSDVLEKIKTYLA